MSLARIVSLVLASTAVALALLLFITWRAMGPMTDAEVTVRYGALIVADAPAAEAAQAVFGDMPTDPPAWARRLAVVWHKADVLWWWWLPLVVLAVRWLVGGSVRRRQQRGR